MNETIDPKTSRSSPRPRIDGDSAYIEILFHPDLARIGERFDLAASSKDSESVVIGRDEPAFSSERPLADPCVSRRAIMVVWSARTKLFTVAALPESKRPIHLMTIEGAPVTPSDGTVPPGTLIAIGDRILLHVAVGPKSTANSAIVGSSPAVARLRQDIRSLASARDSVLVYGETGVGKELVARALHDEGDRCDRPFVPVNCAALPESLVESELFGHARGAFSGAQNAKAGLFRSASGGTLFLDEVGELPLPIQAKLLRVLQNGMVRPIGESAESPVDVRVVVATNRDLARDADEGRFRSDLYARLEAPRIDVPSLRARKSDIPILFVHFLEQRRKDDAPDDPVNRLWREPDAHSPPIKMTVFLDLLQYDWPRNVRELEKHAGAIALATREAGELRVPPRSPREAKPPSSSTPTAPGAPSTPATDAAVDSESGASPRAQTQTQTKRRPDLDDLLKLLDAHDYVQNRLATTLGVSRTTLDKWMRELGIRRPKDVPDSEIEDANRTTHGDVEAMARTLRVSIRGLKLRLKEMGL